MARRSFSAAVVVGLLGLMILAAAPAEAKYTDEIIAPQDGTAAQGWQAGVCEIELECSPESPPVQFSTQAAAHPKFGFTQFITKAEAATPGEPVGFLKDVRVDLPVGLSVDPQATPQCPLATFEAGALGCPVGSVVGASLITLSVAGVVSPVPIPAQVYDVEPAQGEPALFGFEAAGAKVFLKSDVDWAGDYHEGFTIAVAKPPIGKIFKNRLVFFGTAGGAFLTNPSTCHNPAEAPYEHIYSTFLRADSYEIADPSFPEGATSFEAPLPPGVKPTGCAMVPFEPAIGVTPGTQETDSPDGATVDVDVPFKPPAPIANSNVKTARVTLPLGMGLNPSGADSLKFCDDSQFNKGSRAPVACPAASKIGSVAIETPPLPAGALTGDVFVGKQLSREPTSGDEYRIFVDAESARYGVSVRLVGKVSADPATGQLTTTFAENPQVPFTSFKLSFAKGAKAVLTSAPSCGPNTSTSRMTPYSETADATPSQAFNLTKAPGGGHCPATRGVRPFAPGFSTSSKNTVARHFSNFAIHISRADGEQEIKGTDFRLPPGVTGKLKGIPYCPPKDLAAAAAGRAGEAERKKPSCPAKSLVGSASIKAGSGGSPVQISGNAYLAGPYESAPLSLAVVTPAVAGPFDLGTVVVRVPLQVDPESARVHPLTDEIPDVYGGAKLDIRAIDLNVDRKKFIVNPTSCRKLSTQGSLLGGGEDPTNPATFSAAAVSAPYRAKGCKKLHFRPRFSAGLFGSRKEMFRNHNPELRATVRARPGDANLRRASVALPKSIILDQRHIGTVCTRPQLAANQCPKASRKGFAHATSPLLGKELKGPVYLVPGKHILPDLLVDLHGQVNIRLRGATKTIKGQLRNTFNMIPDVPVSKFRLRIYGGKRGVLLTDTDLCRGSQSFKVALKSQNGKHVRHPALGVRLPGCASGKKPHKHGAG